MKYERATSNDNTPAEEDPWVLPPEGEGLLRFIEIDGRLVQFIDRDPVLNKELREAVSRLNLRRGVDDVD